MALRVIGDKLLITRTKLSTDCCCCTCAETCLCFKLIVNGAAYFKGSMTNNQTYTVEQNNSTSSSVPISLETKCGVYGPNDENGWLLTLTHDSDTYTLFFNNTHPGCCPDEGTYHIPHSEDSGYSVDIEFYKKCGKEELGTWTIYDTTNNKILQFGPIVAGQGKNATLENLDSNWKPIGYYSRNFHARLQLGSAALAPGSSAILDEWDVSIPQCPDASSRYPTHSLSSWTRTMCWDNNPDTEDPCDSKFEEITLTPGGLTRTTAVNFFQGTVDYEYTNIFNWDTGSYANKLPTKDDDVWVYAACLNDAEDKAECKNLTIQGIYYLNGFINFGITINAYGDVIVNYAHVCSETYNTTCSKRGVIKAKGSKTPQTKKLSDDVTYEYNGAVIFTNGAALTGTVDYSGSNQVAVTFDNGSFCDFGHISGGQYIMFINGYVSLLGNPSLGQAAPTYSGNWILTDHSSNYGAIINTSGYVRFFDDAYNEQVTWGSGWRGTVTSSQVTKFYDRSYNNANCPIWTTTRGNALITNDAEFRNYAYNLGEIDGNANFYNYSYNDICRNFSWPELNINNDILGDVTFWDSAYNKGVLTTPTSITFWQTSYNDIGGKIKICTNLNFNDDSYNKGSIICEEGGNPTFSNQAENRTSGTIDGEPIFQNTAINFGTIGGENTGDCLFENNATNAGTITIVSGEGVVTFKNSARNLYDYTWRGDIDADCVFENNGSNQGRILGNCTFSNESTNFTFGFISGNCVFNDTAENGGSTNITYTSTNAPVVIGNCTFNANSRNRGYVYLPSVGGSCVFNSSSANLSGYITYQYLFEKNPNTTITFNDFTTNGVLNEATTSYVIGTTVTFNGTTSNFGRVYNTGGGSVTTFNSATHNYGFVGYGSVTFNTAINENGATVLANATFATSSQNLGTVDGDADFDGTSCNSGTVTGTITGNPAAC